MDQSKYTRRAGLTLFGLLVILAILAILLAMLLPAIQKVREAAFRMNCANNLRQMAIALHNYHDVNNKLPGLGVGGPDADKPESGSWCFRILPYVEQDNVYKQILQGNKGNVAVRTYYSPTRRPPQLYDGLPKIDYAGNTGTGDDPTKPQPEEEGAFNTKGLTLGQITAGDGASNTLLLGVKGMRTTAYLTGKGAGDQLACWVGGTNDTLRSSHGDKRPPLRDVPDADHERGFGSPLAKVCNFALCDGSVRAIPYAVKGEVFKALCGRNDGLVIPADF
jgi:hypothetical protein